MNYVDAQDIGTIIHCLDLYFVLCIIGFKQYGREVAKTNNEIKCLTVC